jgi:glycine cleavage system H lipoate-binding protein
MTVLLVVLTFLTFLALDYAIRTRRSRNEVLAPAPSVRGLTPVEAGPVWVAGYRMPEGLHYHPGHTWTRLSEANCATVGVDDFARELIGKADRWVLPPIGSRVRQGAPAFRARLDGHTAEFLSPVDGTVVAVNSGLEERPSLPTDDAYGRGWVLKVEPEEPARSLRNLLSGSAAVRWMEDARERLEWHLMSLSGTVLQDGGQPAEDFARHLTDEEWRRLAEEFLRT